MIAMDFFRAPETQFTRNNKRPGDFNDSKEAQPAASKARLEAVSPISPILPSHRVCEVNPQPLLPLFSSTLLSTSGEMVNNREL